MNERMSTGQAVHLTAAARSDTGRQRQINEDSCAIADLTSGSLILAGTGDWAGEVSSRPVLLAVSDGMGGHEAGEVASRMVVESLGSAFAGALREGEFEQAIEAAVRRANSNVHTAAHHESRAGMGATLTAAFVSGAAAYVVEVGDSRGYLLRAGRLRQVTRDQSMVQMLVDKGVMTADDARNSSNKNMILQAMGLADDVHAAICRLELKAEDRLLLCSDGVSNELRDDELREVMTSLPPAAAASRLIELANSRGGRDNLTAIVAEFSGDGFEGDPFDSITRSMRMVQEFDPLASKGKGQPSTSGKSERVAKAPVQNLPPPGMAATAATTASEPAPATDPEPRPTPTAAAASAQASPEGARDPFEAAGPPRAGGGDDDEGDDETTEYTPVVAGAKLARSRTAPVGGAEQLAPPPQPPQVETNPAAGMVDPSQDAVNPPKQAAGSKGSMGAVAVIVGLAAAAALAWLAMRGGR